MPTTLNDLAEELILGIGVFLPQSSLARLARCSSRYYAMCIELLYSHCTVGNRKSLKILIYTIIERSLIGPAFVGWIYVTLAGMTCVAQPRGRQNISTWTGIVWMEISCWGLITVLLCLVPKLSVLGLPALGEERRWHGVTLKGSHYEVSTFSNFIARLAEDQRTESPDIAPLRVLENLESITIAPDFYHRRTRLDSIVPLMVLRSVERFKIVSM
ncbi:uncharacterized protein EAE97_009334 [Botrytis byssoidea]|uniref:F-box domain-containing protein n=1 Tax=Botrytis byssoidea TaxID=139641 RepID=A0A9P5I366_9HELO|nr:uncharacterized protein EAE97_009334 [Botrytis byssoidea]KAF7931125.1 hypothetical protein EAE97_009334 [Botrytis byssoidea]